MRRIFSAVAVSLLLAAAAAAQVRKLAPWIANDTAAPVRKIQPNYGESSAGNFPNWDERALLEYTNRARSQPSTEMTACGTNCAEGSCYGPMVPFGYVYNLNQAARFHDDEMGLQNFFSHPSICNVVSNIASIYPSTCNGNGTCACNGLTPATNWDTRIGLFGATAAGENIAAGYVTPYDVFYAWLYEATTNSACGFHSNDDNGHRWNILAQTAPLLGNGYDAIGGSAYTYYWTQDFGSVSGVTVPKIPSAAHWTSVNHVRDPSGGDATVEFWANWYDSNGPTVSTLVLDGVTYPMNLATGRGTSTNGAYTTSRVISDTICHTYHFAFTSVTAGAVRYPDTGELGFGSSGTCPDWSSCAAPSISTQPANVTINEGTPTTLSVVATGSSPSYQWYIGSSGDTSNPMTGATSTSIVVTPNATTTYWVQISTACGNLNSNSATVTVNPVASGSAAGLYLVTPCRLIDTRNANGPYGGPALGSGAVRNVIATGQCGVASGATSLALNVTVVSPAGGGWLTLYPGPSGSPLPSNSTINYTTGKTRANNAVISLGSDGSLNVYNSGPATVNFIIDVNGYFK